MQFRERRRYEIANVCRWNDNDVAYYSRYFVHYQIYTAWSGRHVYDLQMRRFHKNCCGRYFVEKGAMAQESYSGIIKG